MSAPAAARVGAEGFEIVEEEACGHGFWDWRCLLEWVLAGAALRQAQGKASAASSCCCSSPCEGRGRLGGGAHGSSRSQKHPSPRSEEHTSELQSLMSISYAVFCL